MMIGPEAFFEETLKGKDAKQILTIIRGLKNKIGHLKNKIENPMLEESKIISPSDGARLYCYRGYLERAFEAYKEVGGIYKPSQAEVVAQTFDDSIPYITQIILEFGGFFGDQEVYTVCFDNDKTKLKYMKNPRFEKEPIPYSEKMLSLDKDGFLEALKDLHIGEWRTNYSPSQFGYEILDGADWKLEIQFSNGHKTVHKSGMNVYPYNFDGLCGIMEVEYKDEF